MTQKKEKKKKCFIIMPITTPKSMLAEYGKDEDHFTHVLKLLFMPAVEKAGLEAIPPQAKGDEVIHGRIVEKLDTADLVLCDMSTLNANVFFEFGIRTSLDKKVCLVTDNLTKKVPFDANIINYHIYLAGLNAWEVESEVGKLTVHINETMEAGGKGNSLWKYFGVSSVGVSLDKGGPDDQIALMREEIRALRSDMTATGVRAEHRPYEGTEARYFRLPPALIKRNIADKVAHILGQRVADIVWDDLKGTASIMTTEEIPDYDAKAVFGLFDNSMWTAEITLV